MSAHQRQSRIHVFPGGFQPDVIGVFGDGQGAGSSRKEVEVIDVVTWSGDDWMEPGTDKDGVAILRSDGDVTREIGGVEALEREAFFRTVDAVVVDFVEVDFGRGVVDVVFVGRKAGPVAAGSVDLNGDKFISGEIWTDDVDDLAGCVSTATKAANDVFWSDQFGLKFCLGRGAAFGDFADGFGLERGGVIRGEVEAVRQSIKNVFSLADGVRVFTPIHGATAAEEDEGGFFTLRGGGICFAGIQAAGGHAHPFSLDTFAGKVEKFAGLGFGERTGMNDVWNSGHEAPQHAPAFPGASGSGKATASTGKSKRFAVGSSPIRNRLKSLRKAYEIRVWVAR